MIFQIIDDDVYFLCLGADSSFAEFLSLILMNWTLLKRNLIHRSRKVSPMHLRVGGNVPGFMLEVIRKACKIRFVSLPPPKYGVNILSAIKEEDSVSEAILDLLKMNCIVYRIAK